MSLMSSRSPLLTVEDVARQLAVATRTVYEWAAEGRLPSIKLGRGRVLRFRQAAVDAFVEARERKIGGQ